MACYHPVRITVKRKAFQPGGLRVLDKQVVPCGSCLGCRAEQARQWSVRIMHEAAMHDSSWFLTMTYQDGKIPENGSLDPKDLRRFFKTLRKDHKKGTVSYYAVGEYGDRTERPHYHAIVFGCRFDDRTIIRSSGSGHIWRSQTLEQYWPFGISELGTLTPASASYVAGYVRKKVAKKVNPDHYIKVDPDTGELVTLEKEFARMSLRPAIGLRWIEKFWRDVYPRDFVVMEGYEMKPPRYYDKWMEMEHDRQRQTPQFRCYDCRDHQQIFRDVLEKRYEDAIDVSPKKLEAKEKIHKARVSLFQQRVKL